MGKKRVRNIIRSMGVALSKHGIHYGRQPIPYLEYTPYTQKIRA